MTFEILIIAFLLILNGFFALSELAVVSSSKPLLRQAAKSGNKKAALALKLAENPGRFLSTVQVGITLVGILAGAYGGNMVAEKLADPLNGLAFINPHGEIIAIFLVVSLITYFSVVIGELVPKQLALNHPEALAMIVARPMYALSGLCGPVVTLLETSAAAISRLLGIAQKKEKITEAEVQAVMTAGAESGAIEHSELAIMQRIIHLGDRDVKSIMTPRKEIVSIKHGDGADKILQCLKESDHSRYPVLDAKDGHVTGILAAKDFLLAIEAGTVFDPQKICKPAHVLPEGVSLLNVLDIFKKPGVHMVIIVDEYGVTQGLITISDILEAVVGMLPSNYNMKMPIVQREDGSWLIDGITPIHEVKLSLGLDQMETAPEYDTIAGLLLYSLGKIPAERDVFEKYGYRFEVIDMDGSRIDKILARKIEDPGMTDAGKDVFLTSNRV